MAAGTATEIAEQRDIYGRVRPRLKAGVEQRRNDDGDLVLADSKGAAYMGLKPSEEPLVAYLDGEHDLNQIVNAGMQMAKRVRPMGVLGFLQRVWQAGLLVGVDEVAERLFGVMERPRSRFSRALGHVLDFHVHLGLFRLPLELGRILPGAIWGPFHVLAFLGFVGVWGWALVEGRASELFQPFPQDRLDDPLAHLQLLYMVAAAVLSARGIIRGLMLRSRGVGVRSAGLRVLWGIAHFDIDDRERRAATRADRLQLAWLGLSSLAAIFAVTGGLYLHGVEWSELMELAAVISAISLLFNSAPYLKTDGREVVGIVARVSGLRKRSTSFLVRRAFVRAFHREPLDPKEKRYLAVITTWLAHGLALIYLLKAEAEGALHFVQASIDGQSGTGGDLAAVLTGLIVAGLLFLALGGIALGMVILFLNFVKQVLRPPPKPEPLSSVEVDDSHRAAFIDHIKQIPFFSLLPHEYVDQIFARMRLEIYGEGKVVIRQGDEGKRFFFIEKGRAAVEVTESSGLTHEAARLGPGDFFGEVALLEDVPRTATIRAVDKLEVLSLAGYVFRDLLAEAGVSKEEVQSGIRNAAFLRNHALFTTVDGDGMRELLAGLNELRIGRGEAVVRQGETGDSLYLIREGSFTVSHHHDEGGQEKALATLEEGDYFGEIAVMSGVTRTATVSADMPSIVLEFSEDLFRGVMMGNFQAVLQLDQGCADRLELLRAVG